MANALTRSMTTLNKKMAKKSTKKKKKPAAGPITDNLKKMAAALMILAAVTFLGAVLLRILIEPSKPVVQVQDKKKPAPAAEAISKNPRPEKTTSIRKVPEPQTTEDEPGHYEVYDNESLPETLPEKDKVPKQADHAPKIAIIIDDIGYDRQIAEKFMDIGVNLTFAVLPYGTYHKSLAARAHARGYEVMLHLPMEPNEYPQIKPGRGAILADMGPDTIINILNANIEEVPYITGINNHMGSRITANSTQMYQIFSAIKKKNLFFLDSRTTSKTICKPSARLFRIKFAERDIFIDHIQTEAFVDSQLKKLVAIAKTNGYAVGIGHPHEVTYSVLKKALPPLGNEISLVHASEIAKIVE